jgi:hypothetical protein
VLKIYGNLYWVPRWRTVTFYTPVIWGEARISGNTGDHGPKTCNMYHGTENM